MKDGRNLHISEGLGDLGEISHWKREKNNLSWEFPKKDLKVSMELDERGLNVRFRKKDPGEFTWPVFHPGKVANALVWPHWEGKYIPLDDKRWRDYLSNAGGWNTLEGLTMPFWGLDCGDLSLTYIVTNRYNNVIRFSEEEKDFIARFTHQFSPNHAKREYGFVIQPGENNSPVEPALKFRRWLVERDEFVCMKEKMKNVPRAKRLKGAAQVYLWGDAYLSPKDLRNPENRWKKTWKPFCLQLIQESNSDNPTVGKRIKSLMKPERWKLVVEASEIEFVYQLLQRNIAYELSRLIGMPDFYHEASWQEVKIPDEAKILLSEKRSSLSPAQTCWLNALLLKAAYPEYFAPLDEWGDALSTVMLKKLKDAGFDRLRICFDGWEGVERRPEVVRQADRMGYLFGVYDSFHSIHDPALRGTDATWPTAQFCKELYETGGITRRDGSKKGGFKKRGYTLSPIAARPYVEKRVKENFTNAPYNYYFVDCDAFGQVYDDYTPGRQVTQRQDAMARCDRMAWIRDTFNVVIGSEGGSSYSAPVIHLAEGMFLSCFGWGDSDLKDKESEYYEGGFWPPQGPDVFFKPAKLKEIYRYYHFDPRFRLPLFEAVFHDSVVATNHWGKSNLKYPEEKNLVFLTQLLYQTPPLYHINADTFEKRKAEINAQYEVFSPLHRELGFSRLTDFSWLTDDRLVQRTVFDDQVEIVANFSGNTFSYKKKNVPDKSVLVHWKEEGKYLIHTP